MNKKSFKEHICSDKSH